MKAKVLLVDDDHDILDVLSHRLGQDYDVYRADDGMDAIYKLESDGPFAVVVSDWRMPGVDGIQLFTEMMEQAPETARIMMSGHSERHLAVDAVNQGYIFRFLSKPYNKDELLDSVEAGVEQFAQLCSARGIHADLRLGA